MKTQRQPLTWLNDRHYNEKPENKSAEQCRSHGEDHAAYGWTRQLDPRWTEEQREAYLRGYYGEE